MRRIIIILTLLLLAINIAFSQQDIAFTKKNFESNKKGLRLALRDIKAGDMYFEAGRYYEALPYYLKADEFNSYNSYLNYKIGKCYLNTTQSKQLHTHLRKAYLLNSEVANDIHYLLGQSYQLNEEWDKAIEEYEKHKQVLTANEWESNIEKIVKRINECKTGKRLSEEPVNVRIENMGEMINSPYPDYSPIFTGDELVMYFTSRRNNTTGGGKSKIDQYYFEDVYVSEKINNMWEKAENTGKPINSATNDATIALSINGERMLIYKDANGGDIFESVYNGYEWEKPYPLPASINSAFHESYASFSYDKKTIYFVSDNPKNNFGEHDIFYSKKLPSGEWSEAKNLGNVINTKYDEAGIYMHPDGKTLYFASKGHQTMGGYDIFKSVYNESTQTWSSPENLGYPINSPYDDVFVYISSDQKRIYYSSSTRQGFGNKDIYIITLLGPKRDVILDKTMQYISCLHNNLNATPVKQNLSDADLTLVTGTVLDEANNPISADIEVWDNTNQNKVADFKSNPESGHYVFALPSGKNYGVLIKVDDYLIHTENFDLSEKNDYNEIKNDIVLKKPETGKNVVLRNIFFDFDKYSLRPESYREIQYIADVLNEYPNMTIEISGHTDNKGTESYNQRLSELRARAVYNVLVNEKGINKKRLKYKGYGESKPSVPNANPDGTDNPENRQLNRRTEFTITSI